MKEHNCPNCAAPIHDVECPYCGTLFIDFASMDIDHPFFIRFKHDNQITEAKVNLRAISFTQSSDYINTVYDLHSPELYLSADPVYEIAADMITIPMEDNIMLKHYRLE